MQCHIHGPDGENESMVGHQQERWVWSSTSHANSSGKIPGLDKGFSRAYEEKHLQLHELSIMEAMPQLSRCQDEMTHEMKISPGIRIST